MSDNYIQKALEYIDNHITSDITLNKLQEANLHSKSYDKMVGVIFGGKYEDQ